MERLPRGRHGFTREYVVRHQRERLVASLVNVLSEQGFEGTTVSLVGQHAAVSKSDFYRHFVSKDECFVEAYKESVVLVREKVVKACAGEEEWALGVYAGLDALLSYFAAEPARARLVWIEGLRAGQEVCGQFQEAVQGFAPLLGRGAPPLTGGMAPLSSEVVDEAVVGGVASLLGRQVLAGRAAYRRELLPDIAEFALSPYLGVAEARRIISRQ